MLPRQTSQRQLIRGLIDLGWTGPFPGGRHRYMRRGRRQVRLPNYHGGDIDISLLGRILKQAGIEDDEWNRVIRSGHGRRDPQERESREDTPLQTAIPPRQSPERQGQQGQEEALDQDALAIDDAEITAIVQGRITIVPGEWYLAVYCDRCLWTIPLVHDPSRGRQPGAGPGVLRLTCPQPECGLQADYSARQVVSLLAVEEGSLPGPPRQE